MSETDGPQPAARRDSAPRQYGIENELPADGRVARAVRTRRTVADALLALIEDGDLRPTSKAIAERAGVSERTIFQHFEDLETLFSVAADRIGEGIARNLEFITDQGPLDQRIASYLDELLFLHESMSPVRRASRLHEPFSPVLTEALGVWRSDLRKGIDRIFSQELSAYSDPETRREAVEALALIVTWSSWENMRQHSKLSPEQARRVMELGLRAVFHARPDPQT